MSLSLNLAPSRGLCPIKLRKHYIGTWNVRSMSQGKLQVVKQEMARVNIDILVISELDQELTVAQIMNTLLPNSHLN